MSLSDHVSFGEPRLATTDDLPQLVEVINRAYIAESGIVRGHRTDRMNLRDRFETANTWFLVVDRVTGDDRAIAGCVCLDCDGKRGHIGLLSVDPQFQGHKLGAKLLRAAESFCQSQMGCADIELEVVSVRHDLFPFYEKMGYERIGIMPFPAEDLLIVPAHLVVMRKIR